MPPREQNLRTALEMIPINILRKIIEEKEIQYTSRRSEDLINRLLEEEWTDDQFDRLKSRIADIQREKEPYSRYISKIEQVNTGLDQDLTEEERIVQVLRTNSADFDDNNQLVSPGVELESTSDPIKGIRWTESVNYRLNPKDELKKEQTLYDTGFKFDLSNEVLFIDCSLPANATSFLTKLEGLQIDTGDVGHEHLSNRYANSRIQEFVDEFEELLDERNQQGTLGSRRLIEVDIVEMLLDEADLKDVKIGGHTDIMQNTEVQRFQQEHDSRIVRLEGKFNLGNKWFDFTTGYTEGMGQVSVKKKGKVEERPDLVEEAFEVIYDPYYEYFVDV